MQVSPFVFEPDRSPEPADEPGASPIVRASPTSDDDDQQRDESIEEPGYGHGV